MSVKILHLSTSDSGGAGRATVRLHQALLKQGIDSQMLVQYKNTDIPTIQCLSKNKKQKIMTLTRSFLDQFPILAYKNRTKDVFSSCLLPSNKALLQKIDEINPDIIHLHWINSGFLIPKDLLQLKKPIFWSLHDMNPFTGGCHYVTPSCKGAQYHCGKCPHLASTFKYDLSFLNFKNKHYSYKKIDFVVNGLSRWIASEAHISTLFQDKTIVNLPNTIDTKIFRPINKNIAREIVGINTNKKYLGFGAIFGTQIERKGYSQLKKALENLHNKEDYLLIIFGSSYGENIADIETHFLGHVHDDLTLAIVYSSIDVFIAPSLAENLSNAILESLSCGTPVVAFDIGGNSDMIIHKQNGYLAKNTEDLSCGINWILQHSQILSHNVRENILQNFDYNVVAPKYIEQYKKMLINK